MELVLYYIKESKNLLISFLILMFIIGIFTYLAMKNFRQDKKIKIFFYGLFLRMKDIDILKLGAVVIKAFLVFYSTLVTNETTIWLSLAMIAIITIFYILISYKRIVYEVVCTAIQIFMVYFIYTINNYIVEIEYTYLILMIKIVLIVFVLIFTTYLLFRDIDLISEDRVDKNTKKINKTT